MRVAIDAPARGGHAKDPSALPLPGSREHRSAPGPGTLARMTRAERSVECQRSPPGGLFQRPARVDPPQTAEHKPFDSISVTAGRFDTQLFVDDAGSCPVKKQLPAVAGIASSV